MNPASIFEGISLAVILGLVLGKFIGILSFSWLTVKLGWAPMPANSNWKMMSSIALLGGIGFTVSLFIATLTFNSSIPAEAELLDHAKLGIVVGSLISGIVAYIWLHFTDRKSVV